MYHIVQGVSAMSMRGTLTAIAAAVLLQIWPAAASVVGAEDREGPVARFNVPTEGRIMDVKYMSPFDEWWVKCREGESIAIYSLDRQTGKWGRVVFTPKKPAEEAKETAEKPKAEPEPEKQPTKPRKEPKPPAKEVEPPVEEEAEPPAETSKPEPAEKKPESGESGKKKNSDWWNPINILKKGEQIINGGEKKQTPAEGEKREIQVIE